MTAPTPKINGLDPEQFPPIAFVDVDGVIFEEGTDRFLDGAEAALRDLAKTHRIVFFTSRGPGSWIEVVQRTGVQIMGYMAKPLGCAYTLVDDRLRVAVHRLSDAVAAPVESSPIWRAHEAEEAELAAG